MQRAVRWFNATCFRSWDDIHEMGIDRAEEVEAFFALSFNSPALSLLLPWVDELPASRWFDRFEPLQRERFLDWYEGEDECWSANIPPSELFDVASGRWFELPHPMAQPRNDVRMVSLPVAALTPQPAAAAGAAAGAAT